MSDKQHTDSQAEVKSPRMLRFLCLLTFLWSGMCLVAVVAVFVRGVLLTLVGAIPVIDSIIIEDTHGSNSYLLVKLLLCASTLTAAALMWKRRKGGLYVYLASQLALLIVPVVFLTHLGFNYLSVKFIIDSVFTALFMSLYIFQFSSRPAKPDLT